MCVDPGARPVSTNPAVGRFQKFEATSTSPTGVVPPSRRTWYVSFSWSRSQVVCQPTRAVPALSETAVGVSAAEAIGPESRGAAPLSPKRVRPCCARPLTVVNSPPITRYWELPVRAHPPWFMPV